MESSLGLVDTIEAMRRTSGIVLIFSLVNKNYWTVRIVTESDWFRKDRTMSDLNRK